MNIIELLSRAKCEFPARIAVSDHGISWSYEHLTERISSLAAALNRLGIGAGTRCCCISASQRVNLELYFACSWLGAVFVPMSWREDRDVLQRWCRILSIDCLFFGKESAAMIQSLQRGRTLPADTRLIALNFKQSGCAILSETAEKEPLEQDLPPYEGLPADDSLILLTAGKSGHQKAVVIPNRGILRAVFHASAGGQVGITPEIFLISEPFHRLAGCLESLRAIASGGTLICESVKNAYDWYHAVQSGNVGTSIVSAGLLREIVCQNPQAGADLPSLKCLWYGGDVISSELIRRALELFPNVELNQFYGLTECVDNRLLTLRANDYFDQYFNQKVGCPHALGISADTAVSLVRLEAGISSMNSLDEIVVRVGDSISGWYDDCAGAFSAWSGGLFRTGDLACADERGCLYFCGYVSPENRHGKKGPSLLVFPNIYTRDTCIDYEFLYRELPEQFLDLMIFTQKISLCKSPSKMVECLFGEMTKLIPADAFYVRFIKDYRGALHLTDEEDNLHLIWGTPQCGRMTEYSMINGTVRQAEGVFDIRKKKQIPLDIQDITQVIIIPFYSETLTEIGTLAIGRACTMDDPEIHFIQAIAAAVLNALIGVIESRKMESDCYAAGSALECLANAVLVSDMEGRIHYLNQPAKELLFEQKFKDSWSLIAQKLHDNLQQIKADGLQTKNNVISYFESADINPELNVLVLKSTVMKDQTQVVTTITPPNQKHEFERLNKKLAGRTRTQLFLSLLLQGLSNAEIGAIMSITQHTVNYYLRGLYAEFNVHHRSDLISALYALIYRFE